LGERKEDIEVTRRDFLKATAAGVAGLVIGGAIGYAAKKPATQVTTTTTTETVTSTLTKTLPPVTTTVTEKLTETTTATETVTETKTVTVAPTKTYKVFAVKPELCTGCGLCELVCALTWEGKADPRYARIRVKEYWGGLVMVPNVCVPCTEKHCVNACPTNALSYNKDTGGIDLDESKCIKCHKCVDACPASAVYVHPKKGTPLICMKCGECVKICPTHAIVGEFEQLSGLSKILTFESALARPPEEKALTVLKGVFGVESPEELEKEFFFTEEKKRKILGEG